MSGIDLLIEKQTWQSSRKLIKKISPVLFSIIDEINPNNDYPLYLIKYPYGAIICDKGIFQIPNFENKLVPLNDKSVPNSIQDDLGYNGTIPLGLIIEKGIETFLKSKHRIIPGTFKEVGELVSLWRVLEEEKSSYHLSWTITSGARSIFILPKVTDTTCHKNLKIKYGLNLPVPHKLIDQWQIFTHIANHPNFIYPWSSTLLFFSKNWFNNKKDKKWAEFYRYLLDEFWKGSSFRRNQFIFDSAFSIVQENKNLRPNPYLADTVRHLIAIGKGSAPAFSTAIDDSAAPINGFQKVYLEDYGLKKYAPIIMHLCHFTTHIDRPVYYSFQMPTTSVFSPKSRKISSVMADLHELKHIMEILLSETLKGNIGLEKTPLYDLAKHTYYKYYHSDKDKFCEVLPATEIKKIDDSFTKCMLHNVKYSFPEFGPFFRGCISISRK